MAYLTEHEFGLAELKQHGIGPVLLREEIDYLRECHMGEEVTVTFAMAGLSPDGNALQDGPRHLEAERQAGRPHRGAGRLARRQGPPAHPPPDALREAFEKAPRVGPFETLPPAGQR